jgi:hypothetical protein
MTVDLLIIISSMLNFLFFMLIHVLIFRFVKQLEVLKWLSLIFLFSGITGIIIENIFFSLSLGIVLFIFCLYTLLVFIYIISLFGAIESSIRIRILGLVALAGNNGLEEKAILQQYNKYIIIQKRLRRFIASGEMIVEKNKFKINNRWHLIFLPAAAAKILWRLYGNR